MYLLWEFYNVAISELITTTISSVVAVSVVALVFIPHWSALLYIVPMVSIVYIDLLGKPPCLIGAMLIVKTNLLT